MRTDVHIARELVASRMSAGLQLRYAVLMQPTEDIRHSATDFATTSAHQSEFLRNAGSSVTKLPNSYLRVKELRALHAVVPELPAAAFAPAVPW